MAVKNQLAARQNQRLGITAYLTNDAVKQQINKVIGGKNGDRFISAVVSAVQTNPSLQECTNQSILSGALLGQSLNLSPSPQLGQYYLVPFNTKVKVRDPETGREVEKWVKAAQFQLGYKGYIQLAIRSGQYKKLNVLAIKEGELIRYDPLNEEIEVQLIEDEEAREAAPTVGYYAMFEYTNGFRKTLYWSRKKMEAHAEQYSKGYSAKKGYTFWEKNFDGMAYKTMLRQLISKWGIMSIDLVEAMEGDMAVINEDGSKSYVDNGDDYIEGTAESVPVSEPEQTTPATDPAATLFGGAQ
ncbi:MAG: recombinase RecT [Eubacteriales bacterium]|nr:recombinase RecT [Eubacteriales bacterium]